PCPPPTCTLFPYTTLFRSDWSRAVVDLLLVTMRGILDLAALIAIFDGRDHATEPLNFAELFQDRSFDGPFDRLHARRTAEHVHGDRKSTRLNSSHLGISYA